jgi:hypothetical protein
MALDYQELLLRNGKGKVLNFFSESRHLWEVGNGPFCAVLAKSHYFITLLPLRASSTAQDILFDVSNQLGLSAEQRVHTGLFYSFASNRLSKTVQASTSDRVDASAPDSPSVSPRQRVDSASVPFSPRPITASVQEKAWKGMWLSPGDRLLDISGGADMVLELKFSPWKVMTQFVNEYGTVQAEKEMTIDPSMKARDLVNLLSQSFHVHPDRYENIIYNMASLFTLLSLVNIAGITILTSYSSRMMRLLLRITLDCLA